MTPKEIEALQKRLKELEEFKTRIELGSKWLLCACYTIGGIAAFFLACIQIFKELHVKIG